MSHPLEVWCGIECAVKQVDYHFYNQIVPHREQSWFGDQAYFRKRNSSRVRYTTLPRVKIKLRAVNFHQSSFVASTRSCSKG